MGVLINTVCQAAGNGKPTLSKIGRKLVGVSCSVMTAVSRTYYRQLWLIQACGVAENVEYWRCIIKWAKQIRVGGLVMSNQLSTQFVQGLEIAQVMTPDGSTFFLGQKLSDFIRCRIG